MQQPLHESVIFTEKRHVPMQELIRDAYPEPLSFQALWPLYTPQANSGAFTHHHVTSANNKRKPTITS
jgi:hypothetical protein